MAGTPTKDAVCVDKPVCSTAADRACSVDCPCASTEGVCTKDEQCVSGASCVAGSGKKVGRTGNTCLANHCNNDKKDSTETSVDCGGECGCRATFEVVTIKGLASDMTWAGLKAMSRDGKLLAGRVARGRTTYPAAVAMDGSVTELPSYGTWGSADVATADSNVLIGVIGCANPPSCSESATGVAKWTGSGEPTIVGTNYNSSNVRGASSSGSVIVGDYYDTNAGYQGYIIHGSSRANIPELDQVAGVTPDGKYVVGLSPPSTQVHLWEVQTRAITKIGPTTWSSATIGGVNGTTPAVVGLAYIEATDTQVGFRWKNGTLTELGVLSGGKYTWPKAVSFDGGTVVGLTGTSDFHQAFIWTDQKKLRSVVDELVARGFEPPVDLKLTEAHFVSDDGKTIVGAEPAPTSSFWRVVLQ